MDLLREFKWLWLIIGIIFVSIVIGLIFLLINKCISRAGKHRIPQLHKGNDFNINSNNYKERNIKAIIPPLPPRTQFLTAEGQSYENLAELPNYEQSMPNYEQSMPNYEQSMPDYEQSMPDYEQSMPDYEQSMPDYEQSMPDYEQSIDDQPDYVKVEDEENILPSPSQYEGPDLAEDNTSTEDYDDIGGEGENTGEEDYDDVG